MDAPVDRIPLLAGQTCLGGNVQEVVAARASRNISLERRLKRSFDIACAGSALIVLLPFIAAICLIVWLSDGGPPIFRHRRVGLNGRAFGCLKIRSMVMNGDELLRQHLHDNADARAEWEANQKLKCDPRITRLGSWLRKTSLDELPQLFNVLAGDMSLVGPRPIVEAEVARYHDDFNLCFSVTPGITGLWQVSGRSNCSYAERVAMDVQYARDWSFYQDIVILMNTIPSVLAQRGSR